jgi:hypothetical protein
MKKQWIHACVMGAAMIALTAAGVHAQTPPASPAPVDAVSDVGTFESMPYVAPSVMLLRADEKATLRRLEDRQIQELRSLEDRYEKDLRALRAKQYADRQALLKSFERR